MNTLKIKDEPEKEEIVIEGVRYSYEVFKALGSWPDGTILKITHRIGETVAVERLFDLEEKNGKD